MTSECIITNCRRLAPSGEAFCSVHRDAPIDDLREQVKAAYVAGCCAALTWMNAGMPMDDIVKASDEYVESVLK